MKDPLRQQPFTPKKKPKRSGLQYIRARRFNDFMLKQWQLIKDEFLKNQP